MASPAVPQCCRHISVVGKGLFADKPVNMRENVPQINGADEVFDLPLSKKPDWRNTNGETR